jgi:uncharacterized membrane protein YqjE
MPEQEPTLGELTQRLTEQTSRLVHDEVELAKAEVRESVRHAGVGVGLFGATGLLAIFGLAVLVAAAVAALALVVEVWLAAVIVGAALLAIAGIGGALGLQQVREVGPPDTARNLKKDASALRGKHS